ncbi:MAG: tetratricopeptide repeat protein, partial [Treponema sp.]|nr:tetratricopeptide repeat protein [Treponema sp.]
TTPAATPAAATPAATTTTPATSTAGTTTGTATAATSSTAAATPAATTTTPATASAATATAATTAAVAAATAAAAANPPLESLSQPEEFISRAQSEYKAGKYTDALATLQAFTSKYPAGSDEAWWLLGQVLEAKGPQRDIKGALSYYKRLLSEYPQSQRYQEAQQRVAYLERFYFDIR